MQAMARRLPWKASGWPTTRKCSVSTASFWSSDLAPRRARCRTFCPIAARLLQTCAELAYGAQMMGFDSLSERLDTLAGLAVAVPPERAQIVGLFGDIREQVKIIEELTGHRSGADVLAESLARQLQPDYAAGFDALAAAADGPADAAGITAAAEAVRATAACLSFTQAERLLILLQEKARTLDGLDASQRAAVLGLIRESAASLRPSTDTGDDVATAGANALAARWEASLRGEHEEVPLERAATVRRAQSFWRRCRRNNRRSSSGRSPTATRHTSCCSTSKATPKSRAMC